MAIFNQFDFGYSRGSGLSGRYPVQAIYGSTAGGGAWYHQTCYQPFAFGEKMRITRASMKIGAAYGYSTSGHAYRTQGAFGGVYCIWDSSGNLIAQSNYVESGQTRARNSEESRDDIWAGISCTVEANTTYYFGFCRTNGQPGSFLCNINTPSKYAFSAAHPMGVYGAYGGDSWWTMFNGRDYQCNMFFQLDAVKASTGVKKWVPNYWEQHHGYRFDGGWRQIDLNQWNGNGWVAVST